MYTKGFSLYIMPIDFENIYNPARGTSVLEDTLFRLYSRSDEISDII